MSEGQDKKTVYVYVNPSGATHTYSEKPQDWGKLVGRKEEVSLKVSGSVPAGLISEYASTYVKEGETKAKQYFESHKGDIVAAPAIGPPAGKQQFIYSGIIDAAQVPYLRRWADERGARVEITDEVISSAAGGAPVGYRLVSSKDLAKEGKLKAMLEKPSYGKTPAFVRIFEERKRIFEEKKAAKGPAGPAGIRLTVPSVEAIKEARAEKEKRASIRRAAEEEMRINPLGAATFTLARKGGEEYAARLISGKGAEEMVLGSLIKEKEYRIRYPAETLAEKYARSSAEVIQGPPAEVLISILGGFGLAKGLGIAAKSPRVAALAVKTIPLQGTAKITLGTVGKLALGAAGAEYAVVKSGDIYASYSTGNIEKAMGQIAVTGVSLAGGYLGYKAGEPKVTITEPKLDVSTIRGVGKTVEVDSGVSQTMGAFEVTKGRAKGAIGVMKSQSMAIDEKSALQNIVTYVPKQKIKAGKIEETIDIRFGVAEKTGEGIYRSRASEGVIEAGKKRFLAGERRSLADIIEIAKVEKGDVTIRKFTAAARETTGKVGIKDLAESIKLATTGKGADVPRMDVRMTALENIDWVDIATKGTGKAAKEARYGLPEAKFGPIEGKPARPSLVRPSAETRVTTRMQGPPSLPEVKLNIRKERGMAVFTGLESAAKSVSVQSVKSLSVRAFRLDAPPESAAIQITTQATKIKMKTSLVSMFKDMPIGKEKYDPQISIVKEIEVQIQKGKQVSSSLTIEKTITGEIGTYIPPIPIIPVPDIVTGGGGGIALPTFRHPNLGFGPSRRKRYGVRFALNPIPVSLSVKEIKLRGV